MERKRCRIRRKVKKPKTLTNTIKKRLKSDFNKAKILIAAILITVASIASYFILTMPLPQSTNSRDAYEEDLKKLESAKQELKKKQQKPE